MASPIAKVAKGKQPTLLSTDKANELIDIINALINLQVAPAGCGQLNIAKGSAILNLQALLSTINNTLLSSNNSTLNQTVQNIVNQVLQNAKITGTAICNPDGTISITIRINP